MERFLFESDLRAVLMKAARARATAFAVAPSPCACTAFKMPSLIDTVGACWPPRALRCPPAAGAVLALRPLLRFSVASAVPPNRVRIRSAISSSLSWLPSFVRSPSSRASRSEIRCFSCPISSNIAICSFPPRPPNTGHNTLCWYSATNRGLTHAAAKMPWVGKNFELVRTRGVESASPLAEYLRTCRSYVPRRAIPCSEPAQQRHNIIPNRVALVSEESVSVVTVGTAPTPTGDPTHAHLHHWQ